MDESRHTFEWIRMNGSWHVMPTSQSTHRTAPRIWLSHGAHMDESRHTYEWLRMNGSWHVMPTSQSTHRTASHIWLSHGAHMDESRASFLYVTYLIHMGNVQCRDDMRTYPLSEVHPKGMWQFLLQKSVMTHISMSHVTHLNIYGQCPPFWGPPEVLWQFLL